MTKKKLLQCALLAATALSLGGCTAGFSTMPLMRLEPAPAIPFETIRIDVNPAIAENITSELTDLEIALVRGIKNLEGFHQVVLEHDGAPRSNSVVIRVTVSGLKKVSGTSRFLFGSLAGKAKLTAMVDFFDGASGNNIASYKIVGASGGSGFSGGTEDAIEETASAIVDILVETYSLPKPETQRQYEDTDIGL